MEGLFPDGIHFLGDPSHEHFGPPRKPLSPEMKEHLEEDQKTIEEATEALRADQTQP